MNMRKVLQFNTAIGFTIPKEFGNAMNLKSGDYVEVYLRDKRTMVLKKHGAEPKKITIDDAIFADEMFSILMGEEVEPRKQFIQSQAKLVKNLDV